MLSRLEDELKPRPLRTLLARALYNNKPDYPSELSFEKGDVVTVLERNPKGYHGWWICSFSGRIGIAPGNYFEVLGVINNNKAVEEEPCYDDPADWNLPSPKNSGGTGPTPENQAVHKNPYSEVTPCDSVARLTDSGNCSNRSSAFSHSLQSLTSAGRGEVSQQNEAPSSQCDYEDLDALVDLRRSPLSDTLINTRHQNNASPLSHPPSDKGNSNRSTSAHPPRMNPLPRNLNALLYRSSAVSQSSEGVEPYAEPLALKQVTNSSTSEPGWPESRSLETLVRFLQPISQNIEDIARQVHGSSECLVQDTLRRLVEDLYSLKTACSILIDLSNGNLEIQSTFINCRRVFEDASSHLGKLIPPESTSWQQECLLDSVYESFKQISTALDTITTKALRNSSLLFTNKPHRGEETTPSSVGQCDKKTCISIKFDVWDTKKLPDSLSTAPNTNSTRDKSTKAQESVRMVLEKLKDGNRPQLDEFHSHLVSLQTCGRSAAELADTLAQSLHGYISRPAKSDEPELVNKKTVTSTIIDGVRWMVESTIDLLQKTVTLCCLLRSIPSDNDTAAAVNDLLKQLESRGSAVRQDLNGLLIHTKTATQYVKHYDTGPDEHLSQRQVVPAPFIQRLIGAVSTTRMAIISLNSCLHALMLASEP